jgi:hypothetical protein
MLGVDLDWGKDMDWDKHIASINWEEIKEDKKYWDWWHKRQGKQTERTNLQAEQVKEAKSTERDR